jgi:DNA-binding NarL/FixJ family response regulator
LISLAIIEDHKVLVDSLILKLRQESDIEFLGSANNYSAGRELLRKITPDVLLLDIDLPDGSGFDLLPEVRNYTPDTQVIILTSYTDETTLMQAIDCGVNGFVSKSSSLSDLLSTIRQAAEGEIVMPANLLMGLILRMPRDKNAAYQEERGWERLTLREREVLDELAKGKSGDDIADQLSISPLTVRTHIRNLMAKLGVHSRLEAVSFGLKHGLIDPPA